MGNERRYFNRYYAKDKKAVTIEYGSNGSKIGYLTNLSQSGAYVTLGSERLDTDSIKLTLPSVNGQPCVVRDCSVLPDRIGKDNGYALKFHGCLTEKEIWPYISKPQEKTSDTLISNDCTAIQHEILLIQRCRSQLFVSSLGIIGAWIMGIVGISLYRYPQTFSDTLSSNLASMLLMLLGISFPFIMLAIGFLANLEKCNAINFRRGFLVAVSEHLKHGLAPVGYEGWETLRMRRSRCSGKGKCVCGYESTCWRKSSQIASQDAKSNALIGNIFDSFLAFSLSVHIVFFMILLGIGAFVWLEYASIFKQSQPWASIVLCITAISVLVAASLSVYALYIVRRGSRSLESYIHQWNRILIRCHMPSETKQDLPVVNDRVCIDDIHSDQEQELDSEELLQQKI